MATYIELASKIVRWFIVVATLWLVEVRKIQILDLKTLLLLTVTSFCNPPHTAIIFDPNPCHGNIPVLSCSVVYLANEASPGQTDSLYGVALPRCPDLELFKSFPSLIFWW